MFENKPNVKGTRAIPGTQTSPHNQGERRRFHYIEDIYDPDHHPVSELEKYVVPREGELVFDTPNGMIYLVSHVDWQATLKSTLVPWRLQNSDSSSGTEEQNWIFGIKGGPQLGEALLSVDFTVRPNTARVDATIMRPGAAYAKVYMGNTTSKTISAQYDRGSNMINDQVPVRLAEIVDRQNLMIMTTGSFSVTENEESLPNGTRCMLVFYDEGGNFIPPAQPLVVQHSSYMRDHQIGTKYITNIELVTPWFTNQNNQDRVIVPINVNMLSVEFRAVVHYSDGSKSEPMAVNGTKFSLYGLSEYRPTYPGQSAEVVLTYRMDDDEQHYLASPGAPNHMSRRYIVEAGDVEGAYSPKLYTFPQWDASAKGYRLQHWLYDLDRQTVIDVTQHVRLNDQSAIFKPNSYGASQNMIFNINLRDVDKIYNSTVFKQHTEISLIRSVNDKGKRWEVKFEYDKPTYENRFALYVNKGTNTTFNLANGSKNQKEWLAQMYDLVYPSYDSWNEIKPPAPTHFEFMHEDGRRWRYSINDWNKDNVISIQLQQGKTYFVNWIRRLSDGTELQLATTGVVADPK